LFGKDTDWKGGRKRAENIGGEIEAPARLNGLLQSALYTAGLTVPNVVRT